ncbi:unnamed protein product [Leptosia nina]|uniref:Uncharacterized protein n=1 Tax=Leptosia nina TaxID=320188 RepID=A0AAV1J8U8_9NEOP
MKTFVFWIVAAFATELIIAKPVEEGNSEVLDPSPSSEEVVDQINGIGNTHNKGKGQKNEQEVPEESHEIE